MVTRVNRPARGRVRAREAARRTLRASVQPPHPPAGFRRWLKFISDAHSPHFFSEGRHVHRSGCTNETPQSRAVRGRIMISASIHSGTEMLSPFALAFLPRTVPPPRGALHIGGGGRRAAQFWPLFTWLCSRRPVPDPVPDPTAPFMSPQAIRAALLHHLPPPFLSPGINNTFQIRPRH
jgi:hypothetical protein